MSFPHPAVTAARHAMRATLDDVALAHAPAVIVAVSGGSDSMALAAVAQWALADQREVIGVVIDHGIRPGSDREARAVDQFLYRKLGSSVLAQVEISGADGPEGNARHARYRRLAQIARAGAAMLEHSQPLPVFLGHTANDQAESVLLGLSQGSGPRSMAGMRRIGPLPGHPDVLAVRPFLDIERESLRTVCRELDMPWIDDPSNELDGPWRCADGSPLRRNAIRHQLMPVLDEVLGPGVISALTRSARMMRDDDDALTEAAWHAGEQCVTESDEGIVVDCHRLAGYHRALRTRVLRQAAVRGGVRARELIFWHVDALDKVIMGHDNKLRIDLPGSYAWRENNQLYFGHHPRRNHEI
ncbi:tRNA lysidine(34) synthetase TilS [Trueperella sp. LYQ143]|uniref:tRNA lysidine(34) synthetase TilS n=1 Tax=unclassified Trueperella TaxID=2630174 RepID=UPI0039837760